MIPEVKALQYRGGLPVESAPAQRRAASFPAYPRLGRQMNLPRPEGDFAASADFMQGKLQGIQIGSLALRRAQGSVPLASSPSGKFACHETANRSLMQHDPV